MAHEKIELYISKENCCGCGACMNACPIKAIHMIQDEYGFLYPEIKDNLCIGCRKCQSVCAYQKIEETNCPLATYAAISKNTADIKNSASGGVFKALADWVTMRDGIVFGAAFLEDWSVHHIAAVCKDDLIKLQGSKYTQSSTDDTFQKAKEYLSAGKTVLYSGTPCQIAGLYAFLGKDYESLYTIDIICHGVPSNKMLQSYIHYLEKRNRGKITAFIFRDKKRGWGLNGQITFKNDDLKQWNKTLWSSSSPYVYYFANGEIYRESCYTCKYASQHRPADLTLGDYWGIEKGHPDYIGKKGWDEKNGISVVIANTEKGKQWLLQTDDVIYKRLSSFQKAANNNEQLRQSSKFCNRDEIMNAYIQGGWDTLQKKFAKERGLYKYSSLVKSLIPNFLKRWLKHYT